MHWENKTTTEKKNGKIFNNLFLSRIGYSSLICAGCSAVHEQKNPLVLWEHCESIKMAKPLRERKAHRGFLPLVTTCRLPNKENGRRKKLVSKDNKWNRLSIGWAMFNSTANPQTYLAFRIRAPLAHTHTHTHEYSSNIVCTIFRSLSTESFGNIFPRCLSAVLLLILRHCAALRIPWTFFRRKN